MTMPDYTNRSISRRYAKAKWQSTALLPKFVTEQALIENKIDRQVVSKSVSG